MYGISVCQYRWVFFVPLDLSCYDFRWYRFNVYWQWKSLFSVCIQCSWGIYNAVDSIPTAIVSSVTFLETIQSIIVLIFSEFDSIFSDGDFTSYYLKKYKELLMELPILIVTKKKWQKVSLEMFMTYLFIKILCIRAF